LAAASFIASCGGQSAVATDVLPGGPLVIGQAPTVTCDSVPCAKQIAAGDNHACARFENGLVACWGSNVVNESGQALADAVNSVIPLPRYVPNIQSSTAISAAGQSSCVVTVGGNGMCWGNILRRFDTQAAPSNEYLPRQIPGQVAQVGINRGGDEFLCVTRLDGTAACLGNNFAGQLGNGTVTQDLGTTFSSVTGLTTVRALGMGYGHACALVSAPARVYCWGDNKFGAVGPPFLGLAGQPSTGAQSIADNVTVPREVQGIENPVVVTGTDGNSRTCVLDQTGIARCWGQEIRPTSTQPVTVWPPERRLDVGGLLVDIVGTESSLCGVTSKGIVVCENSGEYSKISNVAQVACGRHFCCVLQKNGSVQCYGSNDQGQLGIGSVDDFEHSPAAPDFRFLTGSG